MVNRPLQSIAVIPARGGSKRLPGKALIPFRGKPMIVHTIEAALETKRFAKIVVSSDDEEILEVASKSGVSTSKRQASLAEDTVPTAPVLVDVLQQEEKEAHSWDIMACLYATAPLRSAADIVGVMDLLKPGECDFAMAVCKSSQPVHQALTYQNDVLLPVWPELIEHNSQEIPEYVFGNGSTYAVSVPVFLERQSLYGPGLRGYLMPQARSVDLDTPEDLSLLNYYAEESTKHSL